MPHCTTVFDTPELAEIISTLLEKADLSRLCRTSKSLKSNFHSLLWRHYTITDRKLSTDVTFYLLQHAHLVRVLDIINPKPTNDGEILALAGGLSDVGFCTQLTHLSVRKNDSFLASYTIITGSFFRAVFSFLNYNHSLRQLNLATRLVLDYSKLFLEAFLALENLQSLKVEMVSLTPTFPTAINMAVTLLDRHPRLEHLLFGDWVGAVDFADWGQMDYEEDDDEEIGLASEKVFNAEIEAMKAIDERHVKGAATSGNSHTISYRRVQTIELPPRRYLPYPMSFLKNLFGERLFPNLIKLQLPNAELASTSLETLQEGCPRLKGMVHHLKRRGAATIVFCRSASTVTLSDNVNSSQ